MILIDTNLIAELFILPDSQQAQERRDKAGALLGKVENGSIDALIPEVAIHECFYLLVMRKKLLSVGQFATAFRSLLAFPGWKMSLAEREIYTRGLEIVEAHPKLEFSDAVIAARAQANGAELATFDRRLAAVLGEPIWAEG